MATDHSKIEVQLGWEKSEWAFVVYVMHEDDGCIESKRFEYDLDRVGDKGRAQIEAKAHYRKTIASFPGCHSFSEI